MKYKGYVYHDFSGLSILKCLGIGGHLLAVGIDKTIEYGYDGVITGFAADENKSASHGSHR